MAKDDYYFNEVYQTIDDTFSYLRKKWNIQIIKGLFCDYKHFKDFLEQHPTLSSKVLAERLKELEDEGIIEKKVINSAPTQTEYYLTEKGRRLNKIIFELFDFALDEVMQDEKDSKLKAESKEFLKTCLIMKES
ncbi:MAG: HxlR-like helix-turn-helix [Methanobacterium sp. PtaB.Bin024]|jgi:DNA-binding HxlR family transcriptional regulator|nr:MAG: HxlR-like helix-turn-helix [Methanobacterium sp. PtaB.Bin024]